MVKAIRHTFEGFLAILIFILLIILWGSFYYKSTGAQTLDEKPEQALSTVIISPDAAMELFIFGRDGKVIYKGFPIAKKNYPEDNIYLYWFSSHDGLNIYLVINTKTYMIYDKRLEIPLPAPDMPVIDSGKSFVLFTTDSSRGENEINLVHFLEK